MMRIVEHPQDTTTVAYRVLRGLAVIAAVFAVVVAVLMIANTARLGTSDPIHSAALKALVEQLKTNPQDQALRDQIRDLDLLARQAFFGSQHFNRLGTWLLAGALVVSVVSFKSLTAYTARVPYPNPADPKDVPAEKARWARQSVIAVALVLVGMALVLALPWKSPLDNAPPVPPSTAKAEPAGKTAAKPAPATDAAKGGSITAVPDRAPAAPDVSPASLAERQKHWPSLRGAAGGVSMATGVPTDWNGKTGAGIAWKTAIPLPGFGSPIVWGDRVFVSGGTKDKRCVYGVDAATGKILWEHEVKPAGAAAAGRDISEDTGYAASTMTTDGARVFAMFATGDLVAVNVDGTPAWSKNLGTPDISFGYGASLEMAGDTLLVQMDQEKNGYVTGFDAKTGAARWKTKRDFGPSWAAPAVVERDGRLEALLLGVPDLVSYEPGTGKELWRTKCFEQGDLAPTPVYADGLLYVAAERAKTTAIDLKTHAIVWANDQDVPAISTPLVANGVLIAGLGDGGIVCLDAKTGTKLWNQDTDHGFYASPILVENRVYLMERSGRMRIFPPAREGYKAVGEPELGEECVATPAVHGHSLIVRGHKHLYRIGP